MLRVCVCVCVCARACVRACACVFVRALEYRTVSHDLNLKKILVFFTKCLADLLFTLNFFVVLFPSINRSID